MTAKLYSERFETMFNFTRNMSGLCGLDVVRKDYHWNWRTVFIFLLINCGLALTYYTVYIESYLAGDHTNLFKTISVIGTAFQGYTKALCTFLHQKNFYFFYVEINGMYLTYETKSNSYQMALKHALSLVKKFMMASFVIVTLTIIIVIGLPLVMIYAFDRHIEILPYQIPFIDNKTQIGYLVTSVTHIVVVFFAGFGNLASDAWLFTFTAHVPLMKNILNCKFDDLDVVLNARPRDVKASMPLLYDILQWHQKYITYCDTIKSTFFWVILVQISTEFISIASTIVCMFLDIWPPAPVFLLYLFGTIFTFCSLGNVVEAANQDITTIIYDSCWYNLTITEQKLVLFMLRESQQARGILIGGVAPLTLNTGLQLTKTIYTFSMMLKEFLMD